MAKEERLNTITHDTEASSKALNKMHELEAQLKNNLIEVRLNNNLIVSSNNEKIIKKYIKVYGELQH